MKGKLRFSVLASGSGGNVCYIETDTASVLVDAGLSCIETRRRLNSIGISSPRLDALIVTHEHSDHIKGAGPVARYFDIPVFINRKTLQKKSLGNLKRPVIIQTGQTIMINDLKIETFTKCHDAADPIGLAVSVNDAKIGLATDLGRLTNLAKDKLQGCRALIVEFNHDQRMLDCGPYPLSLKRRIKGPDGHLSNEQGAELIRSVYSNRLDHIVLAHLSEENNQPEIAFSAAAEVIKQCKISSANVIVSSQDKPTPLITLS